jgi:hypothetical protein
MTAVTMMGQIAEGAGKAAAYQANARAYQAQAAMARQQSYLKASQVERAGAEAAGQQVAAYGHAGVSPSLWVLADTAHQAEFARQTQLYQGRVEASSAQRQADIEHAQANAARIGSYFDAAGTFIGDMTKAATAGFGGDPTMAARG